MSYLTLARAHLDIFTFQKLSAPKRLPVPSQGLETHRLWHQEAARSLLLKHMQEVVLQGELVAAEAAPQPYAAAQPGYGAVSVLASLYSPARSCHLTNDGTLSASATPAPYTFLFDGPPGDGVKFRLRAPDGRYLRSDGREGTPPQWSSVADASTTVWILRAAGDPFASPVQLKSPRNGGHEPCLCNDQPTGGWGGRVKGKWSWCPEGRGDAYWKLVRSDEPLAEVSPEFEAEPQANVPFGEPEPNAEPIVQGVVVENEMER